MTLLMGVLAIPAWPPACISSAALAVPLHFSGRLEFRRHMALMPVVGQEKTIQYTGTSVYLAIAAMLFACMFSQNTMPRLAAMRIAYVLTATIMAALAGISGYFSLFPGAAHLFAPFDRALGTFKDPNVFGPFLIWPLLCARADDHAPHSPDRTSSSSESCLFGLLVSFSRGAWFHSAASGAIMLALGFLTAPTQRMRVRIFFLGPSGVLALAAFLVMLLSFDSIWTMFDAARPTHSGSYDVGEGGRFHFQELALASVLNFPNGMGPFEFAAVHGLQQHNVYLQAFLVYGWAGALAYSVAAPVDALGRLSLGLRCGRHGRPMRSPPMRHLSARWLKAS